MVWCGVYRVLHHDAVTVFHFQVVGVGSPNSVDSLDSTALFAIVRVLLLSLLRAGRIVAQRGVDQTLHQIAVTMNSVLGAQTVSLS